MKYYIINESLVVIKFCYIKVQSYTFCMLPSLTLKERSRLLVSKGVPLMVQEHDL